MKRLTYRVNIGIPEDVILVDHKSVEECQEWKSVLERLAYYEDLEEQGLLPKLPCKVGDTIYYFMNVDDVIKIRGCKVATLTNLVAIMENGDFGKTVFLTQAEAEEALKRMEGEEI